MNKFSFNQLLNNGLLLLSFLTIIGFTSLAQPSAPQAGIDSQWQHADYVINGKIGVSALKSYEKLVAGKKGSPVIVAIIDSGTEINHPDLDEVLWTNTNEIPGNGIDDDKNGYTDDIHGWSFIGGKNGDVAQDNLEITRVYKDLQKKFLGKNTTDISSADKKEFERYQKIKADFENRIRNAKAEQEQFEEVQNFMKRSQEVLKEYFGKDTYTLEEIMAIEPKDEMMGAVKEFAIVAMQEDLNGQMEEWRNHVENQTKYSYNLNFDPRQVVGDDYNNVNERHYGNNHIDGPEAEHGTHVAGIVGAEYNGFGMDGMCRNVQLMIIRCVPDGDERDKDVANAIRYAADNGARIINMSFGKSFSPQKSAVDAALKYAESKNVLMIHAAGNDGKNTDKAENYPSPTYIDNGKCTTWIEVGASGPYPDQLAASFSNYGKKTVDVFAPGVDIYSTMSGDTYAKNSGTSMAAPVAAGVAASVLSYYPELSAAELKKILLKSSVKYKNQKVTLPGQEDKIVKFGTLSATGGVVNMYEALEMASKYKPKKKKK